MTKINYNSESKKSIISDLNTIIDNLTIVNSNFYNTASPNDFYYKNTFNNLKYEVRKIKEDLIEYKYALNNKIEEINKNELELKGKINRIEEVIIDKF